MTALRWLFEDRTTGRIVVAQAPNPWLWVFLGALTASYFITPPGQAFAVVKTVEYGSLAIWALDELLRGVNPWRHFIGAATLGGMVLVIARPLAA